MTEKTTADELMDWFRRVGTKLSNDEYELGVDLLGKLETQNKRLAQHIIRSNDGFVQNLRAEVKKAKVAAFEDMASTLREREKSARSAPSMVPYQRGRADSYESARVIAERKAIAVEQEES